jgi:hypothetical protein
LEYLKEYNGKTYEELPRTYQRRIAECPVTLFLIQPATPEEVKYSIFRRINTGGMVLTDQEIRNAMAKPALRAYLEKLATDEFLIKTVGDQSKRMIDQELALRFLAFYSMDYEQSKNNITTFLDGMIKNLDRSSPEELNKYQKIFHKAMSRCWNIFGDTAFEKFTDNGEPRRKRKNSTLFEVWTVALVKLADSQMKKLEDNRNLVQKKHQELMINDNYFFKAITFSNQNKEYFRIRHEIVNRLIQEVLNA